MVRTLRPFGAIATLAFIAACQSGGVATTMPAAPPEAAAPVEEEAPEPSTLDGIYTAAQAERGLELFNDVCSECHDQADWREAGFKNRWQDESVFQLWYYIQERMPYSEPFSLTRQQTTDVLTYILQLNGLPAGDAELGTDDDSIDDYWIYWSQIR